MTATIQDKPWDFSNVLDLINSLQPSPSDYRHFSTPQRERHSYDLEEQEDATPLRGLGDFSRVFQYLGTPVSSPAPALAAQSPAAHKAEGTHDLTKDDCVSDGAVYSKRCAVSAEFEQPQDDSSPEEQAADAVSDSSLVHDTPTLTKSQRKKRNRKERRAKEAALAAEKGATKAAVSESEADIVSKKTPARKASSHVSTITPRASYSLRERDASGKAVTASIRDTLSDTVSLAVQKVEAAKKAQSDASLDQRHATPTKPRTLGVQNHTSPRECTDPVRLSLQSASVSTSHPSRPPLVQDHTPPRERSGPVRLSLQSASVSTSHPTRPPPVQPWPPSANGVGATQFFPSTVQPLSHSAARPVSAYQQPALNQNTAPSRPKQIEPMIVRSGEDRHWALLMKLINDFSEDRKHLIAPMNLTTHNNDPKGIHVFVDASNIFIGFNDQLKRSRGIAPWVQVPQVDLSFDALALLMERRRPVAKRVLVGSMPNLPAFDKAKAVGYECNILEKVYKARELTERQIYFKEHDRNGFRSRAKAPPANNVATFNGESWVSGNGSGSETNAPQYAPPRMIEQGVDEILHLKILESIVDTDVPGTIVLATGDAAEAEYSQGFMVMAERALRKGWTVELVSWSKSISAMYTKRNWVQAWGERFKIVTLDDYAEELLDM